MNSFVCQKNTCFLCLKKEIKIGSSANSPATLTLVSENVKILSKVFTTDQIAAIKEKVNKDPAKLNSTCGKCQRMISTLDVTWTEFQKIQKKLNSVKDEFEPLIGQSSIKNETKTVNNITTPSSSLKRKLPNSGSIPFYKPGPKSKKKPIAIVNSTPRQEDNFKKSKLNVSASKSPKVKVKIKTEKIAKEEYPNHNDNEDSGLINGENDDDDNNSAPRPENSDDDVTDMSIDEDGAVDEATGEKKLFPYRCTKCSKKFVHANQLRGHMRVHSTGNIKMRKIFGPKKKKVSLLKIKFPIRPKSKINIGSTIFNATGRSQLTKKIKTKTDKLKRVKKENEADDEKEVKFEFCDICKGQFKSGWKIREHRKKMHQDDKFKCESCQFTTYQLKGFEDHVEKHAQVELGQKEEFRCQVCNLCYFKSDSLAKHQRNTNH